MPLRKVKFFRAVDGEGKRLPGEFPADQVQTLINEMVAGHKAELDIGLGQKLVAKSLGNPGSMVGYHIVMYRVSSDDLPMLYENGEFRPLADVIATNVDIAEPAHFAFYPNSILAHLYNHNGPKQVQLSSYLHETMDFDVLFDVIARGDVLSSIADAGGVRLFKFRVRTEDLSRFQGLGLDGMRALADDLPVGDIEVILRATTPEQKRAFGNSVQRIASRIGQAQRRKYVEKAKVALNDTDALSEGREVDILDDPVVLSQQVDTIPGQRRYLEEGSAMSALEDAYRKVSGQLD